MALCSTCGREATVILSRRSDRADSGVTARAFCTPCWKRQGDSLRVLVSGSDWQLDVRDPDLTGIPPERVEYFLTLERIASESDLQILAAGLQQYTSESGRPLPPELRDFAARHAPRPT